jgi:hypothetical protein
LDPIGQGNQLWLTAAVQTADGQVTAGYFPQTHHVALVGAFFRFQPLEAVGSGRRARLYRCRSHAALNSVS